MCTSVAEPTGSQIFALASQQVRKCRVCDSRITPETIAGFDLLVLSKSGRQTCLSVGIESKNRRGKPRRNCCGDWRRGPLMPMKHTAIFITSGVHKTQQCNSCVCFQYKHRNRVPLMVSERAMMFCRRQPLFVQYWITAGVGYGLIKQIGHVISSVYIR